MEERKPSRHGARFDRFMAVPLGLYLAVVAALVLGVFLSITGEAVRKAFSDGAVWHAVGLSFFTSALSTALAVAFAIPSGYVLSRRRFPGMAVADTLLDLPIVLPPLVMGLCVLILFSTAPGRFVNDNLVRFVFNWKGIVLVQFLVGCAFATRVIKAGFDSLDPRYEEVAMTLGAGRRQAFLMVTVPVIGPSLIAGAVITWARIFGLFGPVLLVAGTMSRKTEIMPTTIFLRMSVGQLEVALVVGALMILMSLTTLVVFKRLGGQRYLW